MDQYAPPIPIAQAPPEVRTTFMTKVYAQLLMGIAAFIVVQWLLFTSGLAHTIAEAVLGTSWLLILGGFMVVSWLASRLAVGARSPGAQVGGYAVLVAANALLFATPLVLAERFSPGAIEQAAVLSVFAFVALSFIAIRTSKDFSFLRGFLLWGGVLALALIVMSTLLGGFLGVWFAVAMVGVAGAAILYDTQKIYHSYPQGTETLAAMNLFSSIALLFWYVLQLFMSRD